MSEASIPVDLFNPGQVFACLGFVEAANALIGDVEGGFDWQNTANTAFRLKATGNECPVASVLKFLKGATVKAMVPEDSPHASNTPIPTVTYCKPGVFPFPAPEKPATLPAYLEDEDTHQHLIIDHWGDKTRRDAVKFWAGMGGYSGSAIARDALNLVRDHLTDHVADPFALAAEQSSSFRFDWRRDYLAINFGFSPNSHNTIKMQGYPVVELLAAIGLTHARPFEVDQKSRPKDQRNKSKLEYGYGVAGITDSKLYDPIFLRAAIGSKQRPFPGMRFRLFSMHLDWPGQQGQARCITNVIEETPE